jgi:hypothetical protein
MPVCSDWLKIVVRDGAIISADNLRTLAGILSTPVALDVTSCFKLFRT